MLRYETFPSQKISSFFLFKAFFQAHRTDRNMKQPNTDTSPIFRFGNRRRSRRCRPKKKHVPDSKKSAYRRPSNRCRIERKRGVPLPTSHKKTRVRTCSPRDVIIPDNIRTTPKRHESGVHFRGDHHFFTAHPNTSPSAPAIRSNREISRAPV